MLKKTLVLALVLALMTTSLVFADGNQSVLSKVTGLTDEQIADLNQNYRGFGRILTASVLAKLIDSDVEDVLKAHQDGASFFEIAQNKGVELDQYKAAMLEGKTAYIDEQVKAGFITTDQGKVIKERIAQQIENCDGLGKVDGIRNYSGMRGFGKGMGGNGIEARGFGNGAGIRGNGMRSLLNQ